MCPKVKAVEYHESGQVKRIEFYDTPPAAPVIQPLSAWGDRNMWDYIATVPTIQKNDSEWAVAQPDSSIDNDEGRGRGKV